MDAPEVARCTGALVVGSESTANIARGWGLTENRIRLVHSGDKLQLDRFHLTLTESRLAPTGFTGGPISEPPVPLPWPFDDFDASMRFISERAQQDGVDVKFVPVWEKIDPFIERE